MHFFYYCLISLSILGYGLFLNRSLKFKSKNLGILGFFGIFFLILLSYISSFLIAHGFLFNLFILIIGLIFLFYFLNNEFLEKKDLLIFSITFLFLFIFILNGKNHDDFPYYHFPYTFLLTQESHPFGLGQINNGFRNPSSLFYLNSLFYLPGVDIYLLHIGSVFFLGFTNLFFIKNIFDRYKFKKQKFFNLLNLFFLIFINIFFYRLAEYGTDRLGSILIIISFIIFSILINSNLKDLNNNQGELISFLFIVGALAISMKPFYLIYISLLFFFIYYKKLNKPLIEFLKSKLSILIFLFVSFVFFTNFVNSGCLLFPAKFTCFDHLEWAISKKEVEDVRIWYELWAKGGATPNSVVDERINYITNFNWLSNWLEVYFFNKVTDYFLGIFVLSTIIYFTLRSKIKININKRNYLPLILFLFLYLAEWFLFHPSLRYGGYHIFILIIFIFLAINLERHKIKWKSFKQKSIILILLTFIIFYGRNLARLEKEYKLYDYNIFESMNYKFIGGDKNFYYRYKDILDKKKFNHKYIYIFGKKILVIKS